MPNERISMLKLKQLIGLQSNNLSVRALARALGLSVGAVSKYQQALRAAGLSAAEAQGLSEVELEQRVFAVSTPKPSRLVGPDCAWQARCVRTSAARTRCTLSPCPSRTVRMPSGPRGG
jgi:hypothetical protein